MSGTPDSTPKIDFYIGEDGFPVIHIDTPEDWDENEYGPVCRIYLNDGFEEPLHFNTPEEGS